MTTPSEGEAMLKPCPFCGGEAAYYASKESVFRAEWTGHIYHCTKCQGRVQNTDRQIAQSMWNTRAAAQSSSGVRRKCSKCSKDPTLPEPCNNVDCPYIYS